MKNKMNRNFVFLLAFVNLLGLTAAFFYPHRLADNACGASKKGSANSNEFFLYNVLLYKFIDIRINKSTVSRDQLLTVSSHF